MPLVEGKPIWIESLLSAAEYKECAKKYPNTYTKGSVPPQMFEGEYKWLYWMGGTMNAEEIKKYNAKFDDLREYLRKVKELEDKQAIMD